MLFRSINLPKHSWPAVAKLDESPRQRASNNKGYMKQFKIDVAHASPAQLLTIATELKIMSNSWERFGPRIRIDGQKLQAPSLREPRHKQQATSRKRHNMARFI